jgi:hypothetical protein
MLKSGFLALSALAAAFVPAGAQDEPTIQDFEMRRHYEGQSSQEIFMDGVLVSVHISRVNFHEGKSQICAEFRSWARLEWEGGYRLTNRNVETTFATVRVPEDETVRRCEILPVADSYRVIVNKYDR